MSKQNQKLDTRIGISSVFSNMAAGKFIDTLFLVNKLSNTWKK